MWSLGGSGGAGGRVRERFAALRAGEGCGMRGGGAGGVYGGRRGRCRVAWRFTARVRRGDGGYGGMRFGERRLLFVQTFRGLRNAGSVVLVQSGCMSACYR